MKLTAENTTVSTAIAKPANEGATAGQCGVGASVALNIANTVTVAELEDGVVLTGAHDLILSATSDNSVITEAKAGGAATGGSGVGIGGAIGIWVANNETRAELGSRRTADGHGESAVRWRRTRGARPTSADGSAGGASAGIGIALGLNIVTDSTLATTERNIVAGGDVMFAAHASGGEQCGGEGELRRVRRRKATRRTRRAWTRRSGPSGVWRTRRLARPAPREPGSARETPAAETRVAG